MGGKVSVTTPYGTAISTQDLFIPPSPLLATDIQYMDRLAFAASKTVSITTGGKKALLLFDGTQNQRIYLNMAGGTFSACYALVIYNPNGSVLANSTECSSTGYVDPTTLPTTGTYTILINPGSNATGNVTFTLYDVPPDPVGLISIDGPDARVATPSIGQNGSLTFSGTAGQRIYLSAPNSTYPQTEWVYIYKPDANGNASTSSGNIYSNVWSTGSYSDTLTLPTTGTYTIYLNPNRSDTGSMTFHLISVPSDVTGTISIDGADATLTTTAIGQNGSLTFSGTAGQRIYLSAPNSTYAQTEWVYIYKPDANGNPSTSSGNIYNNVWTTGSYSDTLTLPTTGTYTIFLNPNRSDTGSMTFHLISVPADVTGTISIDGADATLTTTAIGQNGSLTFSGTAGQRIYLGAPNSTYPQTEWVYIYKPDANGNASTSSGNIYSNVWATGSYSDTLTLPTTGTYTIYLNPFRSDTGSMTFHLTNVPADATGSVTINGSAITVTTTAEGQNASVTFNGTSGQTATVHFTSNSMGLVLVTLKRPNNTTLTSSQSSSASFNLSPQTLPTTGSYTIYIDPSAANVGSINVSVTSP
jgi:predicted small integral membrane protein